MSELAKIRQEIPFQKRTTRTLREDFRILTEWWSRVKSGTFKSCSPQQVRTFAEEVVKELFHRQDTTFKPGKMTIVARELFLGAAKIAAIDGIVIASPLGELVADGAKKLIIQPRPLKLTGKPFWLISAGEALSIITLGESKKISMHQFRRLGDQHMIGEDLRKQLWPGKKEFWSYSFTRQAVFETPIPVRIPIGPQAIVHNVLFKPGPEKSKTEKAFHGLLLKDPKGLSDSELMRADRGLHSLWRDKRDGEPVRLGGKSQSSEDLINLHVSVVKELRKRQFDHPIRDDFDRQTQPFLKEAKLSGDPVPLDIPKTEISKPDHTRSVGADGKCPAAFPHKVGTICYRNKSDADRARIRKQQTIGPKLTNEMSNLRKANPKNEGERCGFCQYFEGPSACKVVEGPVSKDLVCDWIQSREAEAPLYDIKDKDWEAFGKGMIKLQPYQHIVKDVAITPEGPLVMIEDTAKPPHRFSLTKEFHVQHTSLEHHWTQAEVDALVQAGEIEKQRDKQSV